MRRPRAVVVGAGPIGLATAIGLAEDDWQVLVLEARRPPLDKACGEGIMPDGRQLLAALGVEPSGAELGGIRYRAPGLALDAPFRGGPGLGVARLALHQALLERAAVVGIEIEWGRRVSGLDTEQRPRTSAGVVEGDLVVLADGLRSRLRAAAGLGLARPEEPRQGRIGLRRHYPVSPWSDRVEVHWGPRAEAYVTPVGAERVGVALLTRARPADFEDLLGDFPGLAARLGAGDDSVRGAGPLAQKVRRRVRGRVALIGDAAGYLDAITGEGISLGLHQVAALREALRAGDLGRYELAARRLVRRGELFARLLLASDGRPWARRVTLRALARNPDLFTRLLAVHTGVRALGAADVVALLRAIAASGLSR